MVAQRAADSDDEFDADPDMALAMGFGGFGGSVRA